MKIKDGYKTTEFWVTAFAQVAAVLGTLAHVLPAKDAAIVVAVSQGAYALSRGLAKVNTATATAVPAAS